MAVELATAYVSIVSSAGGLGRSITSELEGAERGASASGDRAGRSFGGGLLGAVKGIAGPLLAVAGLAKGIEFGKDIVAQASDLNEAGTKLAVVFGDATGAVNEFAAGGATALGQSKLAVLNAAAAFGVYGRAAGLQGQANADFSESLVSLSTDLASFYNTDPGAAAEAISAGLRGESEPLRAYGILLDDATLRQKALELGLISTTKDALTPQNKVLAAQAAIMQQSAIAQGDFARTSGGLANQQRILSANFEDLKGRLGAGLLPTVTTVVTAMNEKLFPALYKVGEGIGGVFDILAHGDFTGLAGLEEDSPIVGGLFAIHEGAQDAMSALHLLATGDYTGMNYFEEDSPVVGGLFNIRQGAQDAFGALRILATGDYTGLNFFEEDSPFVDGLLGAREKIIAFGGEIGPALKSGFDKAQPYLATATAGLMDGLRTAFDAIKPALSSAFEAVKPVASAAFEKIGPVLASAFDKIGPALAGLASQIGPVLSSLFDTIGPVIGDVFKTLAPAIEQMLPLLAQLLPVFNPIGLLLKSLLPILPQLADAFGKIAIAIAGALSDALAAILPVLPKIAIVIGKIAVVLAEGLADAIVAIVPVVLALADAFVEILPVLVTLIESLLPPLMSLIESLLPLFTSLVDAIIPVVQVLAEALVPIIQALLPIVETVFGLIAGLITAAMDIIKGVIEVVTGIISGDWSKVWQGIQDIFTGIWEAISTYAEYIWDIIKMAAEAAWNLVKSFIIDPLQAAWDWITGVFSAVIGWIDQNIWSPIKQAASDAWLLVQRFITDPLQAAWNWVTGTFSAIVTWIRTNIWDPIKTQAESAWTWVYDHIIGPLKDAIKWVKDVFAGIVDTVQDIWDSVVSIFDVPIVANVDASIQADGNVSIAGVFGGGAASGAVVNPRPGGTFYQVGEAGQQELITPTQLMADVFGDVLESKGGQGSNITVYNEGPDLSPDAIERGFKEWERRRGYAYS